GVVLVFRRLAAARGCESDDDQRRDRSARRDHFFQKIYPPRVTASSASRRRRATEFTGISFDSRRKAASAVRKLSPPVIAASAWRAHPSIRIAASLTKTRAAST